MVNTVLAAITAKAFKDLADAIELGKLYAIYRVNICLEG